MNDKNKADHGKLRLTLVPRKMINGIARVRMFGLEKYPQTGEEGWKEIGIDRIRDAAFIILVNVCSINHH